MEMLQEHKKCVHETTDFLHLAVILFYVGMPATTTTST